MMRDVDELIDEALDAEERELLRSIGDEPGFIERAMGMFGAGVHWMVAFMMVGQALLFLVGVWAAWGFFEATDPVAQLRWGLPSAVLLLASLEVKLAVAPADSHQSADARAEANRASAGAGAILGRQLSATIERRGLPAPASFDSFPLPAGSGGFGCRDHAGGSRGGLASLWSGPVGLLSWSGRDLGFNRPRRSREAI